MMPISAPSITPTGIVIFFPNLDQGLLTVNINYTPNNPLLNWLNCASSSTQLWTNTSQTSSTGTLFIYNSPSSLPTGFYIISATLVNSTVTKTGGLTVGLYQPMPTLVIGIPYSMYTPITLS